METITIPTRVVLLMLILLIPVFKSLILILKVEPLGLLVQISLITITKIVMDTELIVLVLLDLKLGVLLKESNYGLLKS